MRKIATLNEKKQKQKQNMKIKTPHYEFIIWDHF